MLTRETAIQLMAEAQKLPHGNYIRGISIETVMEKCNGVGAQWMERVRFPGGATLLDLANRKYAWAAPCSLRHDIRYAIGGTEEMRQTDDRYFLEDCLWRADYLCSNEPWYNPFRYVRRSRRRRQALRMYDLLDSFGHHAYNYDNAGDREDAELCESVRAGQIDAEYVEGEEGTK